MKQKMVYLLLTAMVAASALSGCGKKDADSRAEEVMSDLGEAMENEDEEAAMEALGELDEIMQEEEEKSSSEGEGTAYPADPRWADVKPGETAAQYYDLFIKSGMTIGEVREAIENSEEFFAFPYYGKEEIPARTERNGVFSIELNTSLDGNCYIKFDDDAVIRLTVPYPQLPGNEGDIYAYDDYPVVAVCMGGPTIYDLRWKHTEAYRTALGTYEEIANMNSKDVENLKNTYFAGMDAELESKKDTYEGRNIVKYTYTVPAEFSWNGYSMEDLHLIYSFTVDYDEDKVITWRFGDVNIEKTTWIAD